MEQSNRMQRAFTHSHTLGNHVVCALVECDSVLQQTVSSVNVHGPYSESLYDQVGQRRRWPDHSMEFRQHHRRLPNMSPTREKLGFHHTWNLREPASILLCYGGGQSYHGYRYHCVTNALPLPTTNGFAQKATCHGFAQYWYWVSPTVYLHSSSSIY